MKEKKLMTSFFSANFVDIGVSAYGLALEGFREIGIAASEMTKQGEFHEAAMVRTAVTALLIGAYALAKEHESRLEFTYEKSLEYANVISWGVNALNAAQVLYHIAQNS